MRLTAEIREVRGRKGFLVQEDIHRENEGLIGQGWTIKDAIDDFLEQYNNSSFYDDETPIFISRDSIEIKRLKIISRTL